MNRVFRLVLGLAVIGMTLALIVRFRAVVSEKPAFIPYRPTALPTFALSPTIEARLKTSNSPYVCVPPAQSSVATCTDCALFPVDKANRLPKDYRPQVVPTELKGGGSATLETKAALSLLFAEATARGLLPRVASGYRSYKEQVATFNGWVSKEYAVSGDRQVALANAARYSAQAGHSEHQLGTALDISCEKCEPFDDSDSRNVALWKFLESAAHQFGFVLSYPREIEALTGYMYEPWHIRYIGVEYATELYKSGYLAGSGTCLAAFLRAKQRY